MSADGECPNGGLTVHEDIITILNVSVERIAFFKRDIWIANKIALPIWFLHEFSAWIYVFAIFEEFHETVNVV